MARRILLADDSVTAQNMGRRILHDAGYEVTTVNNGSAALKRIAELKPDLIILDVYMPGYGGLEVCSRLKENKDTARIPVLLTVGKLEPFKPEEARRVRADAYIVKPFEASELLTALTKLEDKIVPGPEPYKQGRFAKAMAAVEHSGSEADFGDQETGWKDRLIIPGGKKKKDKDVGPEPEPVPAKGFRSVVREEEFRPAEPKKEFERPMPAGLPQDIKPEEIAAIAAAVAKINGKTAEVETPAAPVEAAKAWPVAETPAPETVSEESPAATFASAHEEEEAPAAKSEFEVKAAEPEATPEPVVEAAPEQPAPVEAVAEVAPIVEAAAPEAQPEAEVKPEVEEMPKAVEKRPVNDAEVLAALASLTPAGAEFEASATTHSDAAAGASFTGPRWAAEAVAVAEEESTTLLEHEMEKAYAAFAAADAALATPMEAAMPSNGNGHHAEPVAEEPTKPEDISATSEPAAEVTVEAVATETVAPVVEEAAYAAAASASASPAETISENQPVASAANSTPAEPEEGSRVREAELAAAWANWRQIRESIVGEQPTTHVEDAEAGFREMPVEAPAEVAAETVVTAEAVPEPAVAEPQPEARHEEQPAAEAQSESIETEAAAEAVPAETPDRDPGEISSIVDNMLAELKPRLMEELKRKLKK